jgi:hypothetical protein
LAATLLSLPDEFNKSELAFTNPMALVIDLKNRLKEIGYPSM